MACWFGLVFFRGEFLLFFVGFLTGSFIYLKVEPWVHWSPSKIFAIKKAVICKIHQYSGNKPHRNVCKQA